MKTYLHLGLLAIYASIALGSSLFPPSLEVQFNYHADVQVGTKFPVPSTSHFSLRGVLKVQATDVGAVLQLTDITTSLYNGASSRSDLHWKNDSPLPEKAAELSRPFTIHLKDDAVVGVSGVDGEEEWSVNIKRALASLMQLETSKLDTPAFTTKENGLYGYCDAEYSIQRKDELYIVHKILDHSSCKGFPSRKWSNIPSIPMFCTSGQVDFVTSSSERIYTLNANKNVLSIVARGGVFNQPNKAKGELQYALVNQTLVHKSENSISTPLAPSSGNVKQLIYQVPGKDPTQGRSPMSQHSALKTSKTLLIKISKSLEDHPSRNFEKLLEQDITIFIFTMRFLDKTSFKEFFDELVGTSYQQETLRKLFLEFLPKVGTSDAILFMRDLIMEKNLSDTTEAVRLLMYLPFYVREPSEALLQQCEVISLLSSEYDVAQQRAGILSFASLVFKTCKNHCSPQTQESYVRKYLERFTDAATYDQKMLYLQGLSNLEDGKVFDYLEGVIKDSNTHLRFLAVWATMNVAPYHPDQIYNLYRPILANVNEPLEMRVAALTMLLVSKPSSGRLFSLHWLMTSESDQRLKHYYYTTLQSLVNTKDPCYSLMSAMAAQVLRLLPAPTVRHWATGNYVFDHSSYLHGFGAMAQLFLVGDSTSDFPSVFYLKVSSYGNGIQSDSAAIYLKLEGIADAVKKQLSHINPDSINLPQLADILRQMKADPTPSGKVHVEIIMESESRTVSCLYLNESTLHLAAEAVSKMFDVNFKTHYNNHHLDTAISYEHVLPMDLGIPVSMELLVISVMTFRGDHEHEVTGSRVITHGRLDFQQTATAENGLYFYNPMIDIWQGVQRFTSLKMRFPIDGKLNIDTEHKSIKVNILNKPDSYKGIITQMQTAVYVWGEESVKKLHHHCPTCQVATIVTKGNGYKRSEQFVNLNVPDLGIKLQGEIFECEHHNFLEIIESAVTHQNYEVFPASRPLVVLAHVLDFVIMAAPPGSCGLEMRLMNSENQTTELEGSIQLSSLGPKTSLAMSLIHKSGENILYEWKSNIHCQKDNAFYQINLDLMRHAHAIEGSRKLCLDSVINFPTAPTDKYVIHPSKPVTGDITMNWASAGGSMLCDGEPADELPFKVHFIAETLPEQTLLAEAASIWPFNACKTDKNTHACHQSAHEMATLRKYSIALNFSKPVNSDMFFFARTSDGQLVVSAEVLLSDPVVFVSLGSDRIRLDNVRHWIDPLLLNTHYPALNHIAMSLGLIKREQ